MLGDIRCTLTIDQDCVEMSVHNYRDFTIYTDIIDNANADQKGRPVKFSLRVFDSPVGEGEHDEEVQIQDWDQLEQWRKELADRTITHNDFEKLCRRLGEIILPSYARQMYQASLTRLQEGDGLRIRLRLLRELAFLPWEYALVKLHDGEITSEDYWALDFRVSIVRHEAISVPAAPFRSSPRRRVIVAMASPEPYEKYPKLDLKKEQSAIKEKLKEVQGVDAEYHPDFDLEKQSKGVTQEIIQKILLDSADIFHFSGHGIFRYEEGADPGEHKGHGAIIIANENNRAEEIQANILSGLLAEGHIRLVVLDACESGERDRFLQWSSVAMALLRGGIPAVVAMQYSVFDDLTKLFATKLYEHLVAGQTIDEAVTQARKAIYRADPKARDWGAPVLYLRNSGGNIFPPVTDEMARLEAEKISERDTTLSEVLMRWARKNAPASPIQLEVLKQGGDSLDLAPLDALLLLRSAIETDQDTEHWVKQFRRVGSKWLEVIQNEPATETDTETGLAGRSLGLDIMSLNPPPKGIDKLAWSAVSHADPLTSQTAALALLAVDPENAIRKIQDAMRETVNSASRRKRRKRRAILLGTLAETDATAAKEISKELDNDRIAVWWWRVRKHIHRDRQHISRWTFGGALGAGLALAVFRALLAVVNAQHVGIEFAINSYWGFVVGLGLIYGIVMAGPLLLHDIRNSDPAELHRVRLLATLLGALGFCAANGLVAWMIGIELTLSTFLRLLATSLFAGLGLSLGMIDQPRAGWKLGTANWVKRLALTTALLAIIQLPVLFEAITKADGSYLFDNAQWLAATIIDPSDAIINKYRLYPAMNTLFNQFIPGEVGKACFAGPAAAGLFVNCFEQWLSVLDAALIGMVLIFGITAGLHFPQTGFSLAWKKLIARLGFTD